ncbi:hypothetical protein LTR64_008697 [Lithohypha guttulata]|uniref:uncharacterized protein n=1 Tax=Lithohypha guttulata TaxID=1690604 RepID=UPI002DE12D09|nr:hypothetical protein LTR51_008696 [Lithohypha guttulata]
MSRQFSSAARALITFLWDGTSKDTAWETAARQCIENNTKLPTIEVAKVKGEPHKSKDPKEHVSMVLYDNNDVRVTSVHVYKDGTGKFSKGKFN